MRAAWLWLGIVCVLGLVPGIARAQRDTTINRDSAQHLYYLQEQFRAREADTIRFQQDGFYRRAKVLSQRRKWWGEVYRGLFRERANTMISKPVKVENRDQKYRRFNGRTIRRIRIQSLDVFGAKVYDTTALPRNVFEKLGNHLHNTTRERVIRGQLDFKEGDKFQSIVISNNERVLRQAGYLVDSRILPIPTKFRDSVDILVVTQDIFTLSGGFSPTATDNIAVDMQERNFMGLNHTLALKYQFLGNSNPRQVNNYRAYYFIPYISPGSFISAEAEAYYYFDRQTYRARIYRDFLFSSTKNAGSAEVRVINFKSAYKSGDTIAFANVGQNITDGWFGHAWSILQNGEEANRVRFVTSGRVISTQYRYKPFSSPDSNQTFRNSILSLGSVGLVSRDYFRDVLINGYGRTEDIPFGRAISVTYGLERNPNNVRQYGGVRYAQGLFLPLGGYLNFSGEAGSFLHEKRAEQGALRFDALYFSTLIHVGRIHLRQFMRLRYVRGINRFDTEYISISSENGIQGAATRAFDGGKSFVINLETVAFLNFDILSFKAAPFFTSDFGWVAKTGATLMDRSPYYGLGVGLRLYNERLALSSVHLSLNYFPNIPDLSAPYRTNFGRGNSFNLQDFTIQQPGVVRYQ